MKKPIPPQKKFTYILLIIILLGMGLRFQFAQTRHIEGEPFRWMFEDEYSYYVSTAVHAFQGKGFTSQYNIEKQELLIPPPLQSFWIYSLFKLSKDLVHPFWLQGFQILLSCLMIFFSAQIARLCFGKVAGYSAAILMAIYPYFVYWSAFLMTESNYLFLLSVFLYSFILALHQKKWFYFILAALALGLLHAQRINALYLPIFLAVYFFWNFPLKKAALLSLLFFFIPYCVMLPWKAFHKKHYGYATLGSTNGGVLLHVGNNIHLDPLSHPTLYDVMEKQTPHPYHGKIEEKARNAKKQLVIPWHDYSEAYQKEMIQYVVHHPFHFLKNYTIKWVNQFVYPPTIYKDPYPWFRGRWVDYFWLMVTTVGGFLSLVYLLSKKPDRKKLFLATCFLYFCFLGGFFLLTRDGRMNLNQKYFLVLWGSFGVGQIWEFLRGRYFVLKRSG